jgi:hypothetical protein
MNVFPKSVARVVGIWCAVLLSLAYMPVAAVAAGVPRPDLVVSAMSLRTTSVTEGGRVSVLETTRNRGAALAGVSTTRLYLSRDGVFGSGDRVIGARAVSRLRAGMSSTKTSTPSLGSALPGLYRVIACADATRVVRESRELGNCRVSATYVRIIPREASIRVTPASASLVVAPPGDANADFVKTALAPTQQVFAVDVLDPRGAVIRRVTSQSLLTFAGGAGTCTGATCAASVAGTTSIGVKYAALPAKVVPVAVASIDDSHTMTCQGAYFDVNGQMNDGCEAVASITGNHTKQTAYNLGDVDDCDVARVLNHTTHSDTREHVNPSVAGFNSTTGAAESWYTFEVVDEVLCTLAYDIFVTTTGGSDAQECYDVELSWYVYSDGSSDSHTVSLTGSDAAIMSGAWSESVNFSISHEY